MGIRNWPITVGHPSHIRMSSEHASLHFAVFALLNFLLLYYLLILILIY